jgi:hypothetical protein
VIIGGMSDLAVHDAAERQRQQGDDHAPDYHGALSLARREREYHGFSERGAAWLTLHTINHSRQ